MAAEKATDQTDQTAAASGAAAEKSKPDGKFMSRADVAKHKAESDAWIIIHNKVYDITKYLSEHPGGPEILLDSVNGDQEATEDFEATGHSEDARETLKKYLVGEVEPSEASASSSSGAGSKSSDEGPSTLLMVAILVALLAGAFMMYEPEASPSQ